MTMHAASERKTSPHAGLTIMEILVVVVIIGVVSFGLVPVAEIAFVRLKETELQDNLLKMRSAISRWRYDCEAAARRAPGVDAFKIPDCNLYPPDLLALTKSMPFTIYDVDGNATATFYPRPYLARIENDPFVGAPIWFQWYASGTVVATYSIGNVSPAVATGVYDVSPHTDPAVRRGFMTALDGTSYADW
ncbi:MAG TPA: hypothetical protein PLP29_02360 [Candidatus Ozemobacteraceae bacterium]|nr:hypothetical protein [Candidatus Ozemobacteraceae bacterium]